MLGAKQILRYPGTYTIVVAMLIVELRDNQGRGLQAIAFALMAGLASAELPLGIFYLSGRTRRPRYALAHLSMGIAALLSAVSTVTYANKLLVALAAVASFGAALTIAWAVKSSET